MYTYLTLLFHTQLHYSARVRKNPKFLTKFNIFFIINTDVLCEYEYFTNILKMEDVKVRSLELKSSGISTLKLAIMKRQSPIMMKQ